ncbi:MAG: Asp-tRNA(Asn)/Glu-tRNA(Gln) amidotransferase subunit GatC [Candidatus Omnitrophica bacterium]|nr:Asp-tRNA(Asn)/Glu-tRNA(Gln) amidotransferase subunit GatC [Candidatus Omnitrophota bacterium]
MDFQIEKIAELARLNLKAEEKAKLSKEVAGILDYVKSLSAIPTDQVAPTSHVLNLENVFRKDEIVVSEVRDKALKYAPHAEGNFFKVPKIVER